MTSTPEDEGWTTEQPEKTEDWELIAVALPYGVFSEHSVLSASIDFTLGNLSGRLLLPDTRSADSGFRLSAPTGPPKWLGYTESSTSKQEWGYWNGHTLATIRSVVFHIEHVYFPDGRPTYPAYFLQDAKKWVTRLSDWLAVMAGGTTDIITDHRFTWENWDIEVEALTESQRDWLEPQYALGLAHWKFAVDKASKEESAPFPLVLMAAGQRAVAEGDHRRAVFDAASAAETVLRDALGKHLAEHEDVPADFYAWVMKKKTFGPLIDACKEFGVVLPPQTKQRLLEVRNKVAHPSVPPSDEEMAEAVAVAAQIVRDHFEMEPDLQRMVTAEEEGTAL